MRNPPKVVQPGVTGCAIARLGGKNRHVTIYPLTRTRAKDIYRPSADFTNDEADVLLKVGNWRRTTDWSCAEPGVRVCQVVKE